MAGNMRKLTTMLLFLLLALLFLSSPTASQQPGDDICKTGKQQSPINVDSSNLILNGSLGILETRYQVGGATMRNLGYEMRVTWPNGGGGSVVISGKTYVLVQCHWHFPAEHTINYHRYPLELHMVHHSSDGEIAVIGILYKLGKPDTFLTPQLMEYFKLLVNPEEEEVAVGPVAPPLVGEVEVSSYYRYAGSLTTPPCTEGVIWTLLQRVRTVSCEQLSLIMAALNWKNNARATQPLNGRNLYVFDLVSEEHASS